MALGQRAAQAKSPTAIFDETIAPVAGAETRTQVEHAASAAEGVALVLASPEFQRR
jgi:uncharacterized protein (DUF1800 family)